MKAIGKNIVIKSIDEEVKTSSGLILSGEDTNQLRYKRGVVINSGTEVENIKPGDELYYDKSNSYVMIINDDHCVIIQERDVVLVL
jgi:co-chaperonin GroES (HSP10)